MKHVPYWEPTILELPVNLAVIWRVLLSARELIHISVRTGGKNFNNYAENIAYHRTKCNGQGDQVPMICAPLASYNNSALKINTDIIYQPHCKESSMTR
jgi:hypothetical protein